MWRKTEIKGYKNGDAPISRQMGLDQWQWHHASKGRRGVMTTSIVYMSPRQWETNAIGHVKYTRSKLEPFGKPQQLKPSYQLHYLLRLFDLGLPNFKSLDVSTMLKSNDPSCKWAMDDYFLQIDRKDICYSWGDFLGLDYNVAIKCSC
jgi:hypothetical protein